MSPVDGALHNITSVLVIDDDEVARNLVANHFEKMGFQGVEMFENGDDGWKAAQNKVFDMIVMDWKLPGLSGLALFNRFRRQARYRTTPIVVISGFLDKNDFRLLQEYPCTSLVEKPFTKALFENRIQEILQEHVWYVQNAALIDTILVAVGDDGRKAEKLLKQVFKTAPNPVPLALLAARQLMKGRHLKAARAVLENVLKSDENCVMAMNELGKIMHSEKQYEKAATMLRLANKISPQNLQRLCLLGEVELNLNDPDKARTSFEKALGIDADDEIANSGMTVAKNMKSWMTQPSVSSVPTSFASLMNTMGIALVRSGHFAKGMDQYKSALAFLRSRNDAARVAFNLGLGYMRWGKPDAALPWFKKSQDLQDGDFEKSSGYIRRIMLSGGNVPEKEIGGDQFGQVEKSSPRSPAGVDIEVADRPSAGDGNIIPFPAAAAGGKPSPDEDIHEERVGEVAAATGTDGGSGFNAENFQDDEAVHLAAEDDEFNTML